MKWNRKSLRHTMWMYFILFSALILLLLWFLQIVFLQNFYEQMKVSGIDAVSDTIIETYGTDKFESTIDQMTFSNALLIFVTDKEGHMTYFSDEHGYGGRARGLRPDQQAKTTTELPSAVRPLPNEFESFMEKVNQSEHGVVNYTVKQHRFKGETLVYGRKFEGGYLYISTPLEPMDSTTAILKKQLMVVTVVSLFAGFVIAFFIAGKLSRPLSKITESAKQLAQGNYNVSFAKDGYTELDQLADTLNYTTEELSKVEGLRRELIANISHDLRTPLTMIKAYSEMIRDLSGDNKEKRDTHLGVIIDETDRLTTLVNDILDLSAIQSLHDEGGNLPICPVNFSQTVEMIIHRFDGFSRKDGYTIQTEIAPDLHIAANRARIEQVVYNLIGNALDYAGDNKKIEVRVGDKDGRVRFEVTDSGSGIQEEEIPYIWQRYYRAENHKRSVVGNGLGLSIVKNILEMHGAPFGVTSALGCGSTFWFEIQRA